MKQWYSILILLMLGVLAFSACIPSSLSCSSAPTPTPIPTGPVHADFVSSTTQLGGKGWVTFTPQSTGHIKEWYWNFGNGGTATGPVAKTYYHENGYYSVTLTVEGWDGSRDTMTKPDYIYVYGCST